jgi:hypothetical protein
VANVVCGSAKLTDLLSWTAAAVPTSQVRASVPVCIAAVRPLVLGASLPEPGDTKVPESQPGTT